MRIGDWGRHVPYLNLLSTPIISPSVIFRLTIDDQSINSIPIQVRSPIIFYFVTSIFVDRLFVGCSQSGFMKYCVPYRLVEGF